jgi:hypothetical protein
MKVSKLVYFVLALTLPVANIALGGGASANKIIGVTLLTAFQHLRIAVHPCCPPPGTTLRNHLSTFPKILFGALAVGYAVSMTGYQVGYPAIGSPEEAFLVPFCTFLLYLILFGKLIAEGYSRLWANLVFLAFLLICDTPPFHVNPIISIASSFSRGYSDIYLFNVTGVVAASVAYRLIETLKVKQQ